MHLGDSLIRHLDGGNSHHGYLSATLVAVQHQTRASLVRRRTCRRPGIGTGTGHEAADGGAEHADGVDDGISMTPSPCSGHGRTRWSADNQRIEDEFRGARPGASLVDALAASA